VNWSGIALVARQDFLTFFLPFFFFLTFLTFSTVTSSPALVGGVEGRSGNRRGHGHRGRDPGTTQP
jgi:hypothetical protein